MSNWKRWPRPGASTASTRSLPRTSTTRTSTGEQQEINSLFKTFIVSATREVREELGEKDFCLSVFKDNAGVIHFNDDWSLVFKVETHNSPSALDPYGGALTGIVGVNRDPFGTGMGARLIFNTDVFCFASPFYDKPLPPRLLHPRRIFEGVVEGVEHGGNKSGIPTVNGSLVFDERFAGKPLVFCGTAAIMPAMLNGKPGHEKKAHGRRPHRHDRRPHRQGRHPRRHLLLGGAARGLAGHRGADRRSDHPEADVRLSDHRPRPRPLQLHHRQRRRRALLLGRRDGRRIPAASRCISTGPRSNIPGLQPWEILISEAQERMTLAVPPDKLDAFLALAREMGVEATDLGAFTDSGYFHCLYQAARPSPGCRWSFLHDGVPQMQIPARGRRRHSSNRSFAQPADLRRDLQGICSGGSISAPRRAWCAATTTRCRPAPWSSRSPGWPTTARPMPPWSGRCSTRFEGVVVAHGICPRYSDIDTYHMTANAIDEALRNYVAVGGDLDHVAGLDNFCWCDPVQSDKTPDGEYKAAQLVRANQALYDYCLAFGVPLISGKDSMKNDYQIGDTKISIPPTLLFSVIGKIDDVRRAVTMDVKRPGDLVYLLGVTRDELGGSEYYALQRCTSAATCRWSMPRRRLTRYRAVNRRPGSRVWCASCHDLSDGGLAVALAETAFAGGCGI